MAIDVDKALALRLDPITFVVDRGRLAFFSKSIGETNPVYFEVEAARAAGHPDIPVPPTFFFSMELETPDPFLFINALGIDLRTVLHGEEAFEYHSLVYAGNVVNVQASIVDVTSKKGGALEFITKKTEFSRGGELVAEATNVIVVRNPEATS